MAAFVIDENENNGRTGVFDFENGHRFVTPTHVPSRVDFDYLQRSQFLREEDYRDITVGEYVCWLDRDQTDALINDHNYYQQTRYRISSELRDMQIPIKLLHFNFYSDVQTIERRLLEILLELQHDVNADIIEIPNLYSSLDYRKMIAVAVNWRTGRGIEKPLMGVACKVADVDLISPMLGEIDGVGLNLSRFSKPLLFKARESLKNQEKMVYAISAPRHYTSVDRQGTLGVLINYFGVDIVSNPVLHWKGSRFLMSQLAISSDDELYNLAMNSRYFAPVDYSTHTYGYLQEQHGEDHRLSESCTCPICQHNTIGTILDNYREANANSRAHQVISYKDEARKYRNAIHKNEAERYMDSRPFVRRIID